MSQWPLASSPFTTPDPSDFLLTLSCAVFLRAVNLQEEASRAIIKSMRPIMSAVAKQGLRSLYRMFTVYNLNLFFSFHNINV